MEMSATTTIHRPPEAVWAYVIDLANDASWRTGLVESGWREGETLGVGALGVSRTGSAEAEWRVVAYAEGESVDWEFTSGPLEGRGGYRVVPVDGGTEFTLFADVVPTGAYRLLGPLFGRVGRRQNQADVEQLREILEAAPE